MSLKDKLYINGRWVAPSSNATIPVENPATQEVWHQIPAGNAEDVDAAVRAASAAWPAFVLPPSSLFLAFSVSPSSPPSADGRVSRARNALDF